MTYQDHFKLADDLIKHLDGIIGGVSDPFLASRYVGFVAVVGTTVYELAIKDIFLDFSERKHKVFGTFARRYFERLNGRIKTQELIENHVPRFGEKYLLRFKRLLAKTEKDYLKVHRTSNILTSYDNVIGWRHQFSHQGKIPTTASYDEVTNSFEIGKEVIHCLYKAMRG